MKCYLDNPEETSSAFSGRTVGSDLETLGPWTKTDNSLSWTGLRV
jgi:hypothetical protein